MTEADSCRCGYGGIGFHQCHAGRHPDYPGDRCPNEAVPRLVATGPAALAGVMLKHSVVWTYYCDACFVEAGFDLKAHLPDTP